MAQDDALAILEATFNLSQGQEQEVPEFLPGGQDILEQAGVGMPAKPHYTAADYETMIKNDLLTNTTGKVKPEQQVAAVIREELDAASWAAQADYKIAAVPAMYNDIVTNAQTQSQSRVITNDMVQTYFGLLKSGEEIIGRLPPDFKPTTAILDPGTKVIKDRETGDTVLVRAKLPPEVIPANQPSAKYLADKEIQNASGTQFTQFDLKKTLGDLKNLKGDELATGIENAILSINREATKRTQLLAVQASVQSGLADASRALKERMDLDSRSPLRSRRAGSSEEMKAAQARFNSALSANEKLLNGTVAIDGYMTELKIAQNTLMKTEVKRAQEEARETAKRDTREEVQQQKRASVTPNERQNYVYANKMEQPTTRREWDKIDDAILLEEKNKNSLIPHVLRMDTETSKIFLTHKNPEIRKLAENVVIGKDKQRFESIRNDPNAITTPTLEELNIRKIVENPMILAEHNGVSQEIKKELAPFRNPYAKLDKAAETKKHDTLAVALGQAIQYNFVNKISDANVWRTTFTQPGSPLKTTIDQISSSRGDGKAPFDLVVDTFMTSPVLNENQQSLSYEAKRAILVSTIKETTAQLENNFLYPDMGPIQLTWISKITNAANRAAARVAFRTMFTNDPGFQTTPGGAATALRPIPRIGAE